jgi:hypothetical protein
VKYLDYPVVPRGCHRNELRLFTSVEGNFSILRLEMDSNMLCSVRKATGVWLYVRNEGKRNSFGREDVLVIPYSSDRGACVVTRLWQLYEPPLLSPAVLCAAWCVPTATLSAA